MHSSGCSGYLPNADFDKKHERRCKELQDAHQKSLN